MRQYIIRRLAYGLLVLWGLSLIVFVLMRLLPGDAVLLLLGEDASVSPEKVAKVRAQLGLDKPIHEQYVRWMGGVVRGDFGRSLQTGGPVLPRLLGRLPVTLELMLLAMILGALISLPVGVFSAVRQDSAWDNILRFTSITILAMPAFWIGTMLLVFPSIWFRWAPPLGFTEFFRDPRANLIQVMWPVSVLGTHLAVALMRMIRSSMLEVMRQDYIRTARAKGLIETMVISRHALKNAMIPVVTLAGGNVGRLLGGTVILEVIFSIPGIGRLFLEAVNQRDYTQVQVIMLFYGVVFFTVNLLVDLTYAWFDPRIRYH